MFSYPKSRLERVNECEYNMVIMDVIMTTICMTGLFVGCVGAGVRLFNSIYPTTFPNTLNSSFSCICMGS